MAIVKHEKNRLYEERHAPERANPQGQEFDVQAVAWQCVSAQGKGCQELPKENARHPRLLPSSSLLLSHLLEA
jgi:hypothetical protein